MDWDRGLTLILHTPGGNINATESIVSYLRSKFNSIEVIVPTLAMSAGTMISLSCEKVVLGSHSQLGPIDPQMTYGGKTFSARAVVSQFEQAKLEILGDPISGVPGNLQLAHIWAPMLQNLSPSLIQEAENALNYSEEMVAKWIKDYVFTGQADAKSKGENIARHFNDANLHKSHEHRIGRAEVRAQGIDVEDLEDDPNLQEAVLTLYHLTTIAFDNSPVAKLIVSDTGSTWIKNFVSPEQLASLQHSNKTSGIPTPTPKVIPATGQGNRRNRRGK
jgi:membrane-bound ClpP family serine protease